MAPSVRAPAPARLRLLLPLLAAIAGLAGLISPALRSGASPVPASPTIADYDLHLVVPGKDGGWNMVSISMLVRDDGRGPDGPAAATAREAILARFPGAQVISEDDVSAQFVLLGFTWADGFAHWEYNSAGKPAGFTGDAAIMRTAADTWSNAGANFRFTGGASTTRSPGACSNEADGHNVVGWAVIPGETLAWACSLHNGGEAQEFDIEFNPNWDWTTDPDATVFDLPTTALHEFGHALGLAHSRSGCSQPTPPAMCPKYNGVIRDLRPDDLFGLLDIYGRSPAVTPRNLLPQLARD